MISQEIPKNTTTRLKKELGEQLPENQEGSVRFELLRYYRADEQSEWVLTKRYAVYKDQTELHRIEENIRYLSLSFPIIEGREWNGNKYSQLDEESFELVNHNVSETINNLAFDSLATVEQYSSENLIEKKSAAEKFVKGIGLVYRFREYIFTRTDGINTQNDVDSGLTYRMEINSYLSPSL
jgi:hypothetical protein